MRFTSIIPTFLAACQLVAGDLAISYDELLEGQTATYEVVDTSVGELDIGAKSMKNEAGDASKRSPLTPREALDALKKRQYSCDPGYGYCARIGGCCPSTNRCCSYGYCLPPGKKCCPNGPCGVGKDCCGYNHCKPIGAECCTDESYCEAGNHCYISKKTGIRRCCTNSRCTAVVDGGVTSYAPTSTTTHTYTTTRTQYYYWTYTWYYYVYYWTLSVNIDAYIVTSTRTTRYTTLSVYTTGSSAANKYFSSVSRTLSVPTPASATSLEALAGSTSYASPTRTAAGSPSDDDDGSSGSNRGGSSGGNSGNDKDGGDDDSGNGPANSRPTAETSPGEDSGARALWPGFNFGVLVLVAVGTIIGMTAVAL